MLTAANVHDSMVFEELIDAIEPVSRDPAADRESAPTSFTLTKPTMTKQVQRSFEKAFHQEPDSKKGQGEQQEVGAPQVDCGAHTGLAFEVSQAHDSL